MSVLLVKITISSALRSIPWFDSQEHERLGRTWTQLGKFASSNGCSNKCSPGSTSQWGGGICLYDIALVDWVVNFAARLWAAVKRFPHPQIRWEWQDNSVLHLISLSECTAISVVVSPIKRQVLLCHYMSLGQDFHLQRDLSMEYSTIILFWLSGVAYTVFVETGKKRIRFCSASTKQLSGCSPWWEGSGIMTRPSRITRSNYCPVRVRHSKKSWNRPAFKQKFIPV